MSERAKTVARAAIVAIIDNDAAVRASLRFSLEVEGFAVRTYHSGAELLELGILEDYDCFVIDQDVPDNGGIDLIGRLRRRGIRTPMILSTGHPSAALAAQARTTGVPIVEKPLLGNTLLHTIRNACGRRL